MPLADTLTVRGAEPRILFLRISALGDMVFATTLLDALRARWPGAHIAWLVQPGFAGLLDGDPRVDAVLPLPRDVFRAPWRWPALRRVLAGHAFDWAIDAQGLFKTRLLARLAPGVTRIGLDSKEPGRSWMHHLLPRGGDLADISSEYRDLARRLTGSPAGPPSLIATDAATRRVDAQMRSLGLAAKFVALCPYTTRPQKHWFEAHWVSLAEQLVAAGAGPLAVLGGPADREAAASLCAAMPPGVVNLAGQTALRDLPAWLSRAGLVIGVDTGLTHVGVAMRRPVVALFGSTRPYERGAKSPLRVLYEDLPCAPCRRRPTCGGAWTCMRDLSPARVAVAATAVLGG